MAPRQLHGLMPQDVLVLLKIILWEDRPWRHIDLAGELGLSQTEISFSLERCRSVGLLDSSKRKVLRSPFLNFLIYGLRYICPAQPGPLCRGIATSHSAPPLSSRIVSDEHDQYVWPSDHGKMRGQAIDPIYESAPFAAEKDPELYGLLALVDALRVGRARERSLALKMLEQRFSRKVHTHEKS